MKALHTFSLAMSSPMSYFLPVNLNAFFRQHFFARRTRRLAKHDDLLCLDSSLSEKNEDIFQVQTKKISYVLTLRIIFSSIFLFRYPKLEDG